jgi:hypothetical protein
MATKRGDEFSDHHGDESLIVAAEGGDRNAFRRALGVAIVA